MPHGEDFTDKAILLHELAIPLEMIDNLIYLARHSGEEPTLVKSYLDAAKIQMNERRRILLKSQ